MAEDKAPRRTENETYEIAAEKLTWKQKIKDIALEVEILVIVIAVSITLILQNINNRRHDRELERQFLVGMREDLKKEVHDLDDAIKDFQPTIDYYNIVWKQVNDNKIDTGYIDSNSEYLRNTSYFVFDNGRYEGFKSSGYLRLIQNQELLSHLITLYNTTLPFEQDVDKNVFRTREQDYNTYIGIKGVIDSSGLHVSRLINDPAVKFQIVRYVQFFDERKRHKLDLIKRMQNMIAELDEELGK